MNKTITFAGKKSKKKRYFMETLFRKCNKVCGGKELLISISPITGVQPYQKKMKLLRIERGENESALRPPSLPQSLEPTSPMNHRFSINLRFH
jgi:hypothetical protein